MLSTIITLQLLADRAKARLTREDGATAVEYGLLVALIAAIIVGVVATLGGQVRDAFQTVVNALT